MSEKDKYRKLKPEEFFDYSEDRLSEKERHELERQFQKDPFDAEAAEGLEKVSRQEANADLLYAERYVQRRIGRRRRIAIYSAAAAIASLLIISTIFFTVDTGDRSAERMNRMSEAAEEMTEGQTKPGSDTETEAAAEAGQPGQSTDEATQPGRSKTEAGQPDPQVKGGQITAAGKAGTAGAADREVSEKDLAAEKGPAQDEAKEVLPGIREETRANEELQEIREDVPKTEEIPVTDIDEVNFDKEEAAGVEDAPAYKKEDITDEPVKAYHEPVAAEADRRKLFSRTTDRMVAAPKGMEESPSQYRVTGIVVSSEDSTPLPGVTLMVRGTTLGTVTDPDGQFSLETGDSEDLILTANYVGMETEEVQALPGQPVRITMDPSMTELSEVVVVGYGTEKKQDLTGAVNRVQDDRTAAADNVSIQPVSESTYREALPVGGITAFTEYVEGTLEWPDPDYGDDRAVVVLKFKVSSYGRPYGIRAVRTPGQAFTDEAARVLQEGPDWTRATMSGEPVDVEARLRVVFRR